jgi:hypothetical protein
MVARSYGTEDLGIKLDLVERHAVVDAKIEALRHHAHLHRRAEPQPWLKVTTRPGVPA